MSIIHDKTIKIQALNGEPVKRLYQLTTGESASVQPVKVAGMPAGSVRLTISRAGSLVALFTLDSDTAALKAMDRRGGDHG